MNRFRLLQHAADREEKVLQLLSGETYQGFLRRFGNTRDPHLAGMVHSYEESKKRQARLKRLSERYAARLARAIDRIPQMDLREYARLHYLYGLTHEEISEQSFFSVRTVYRHGQKAKKELQKALLAVSPRHKRIAPAQFRITGTLKKKDYRIDRISRSVATLTARKKSLPFRTVYCYR
jgi:hypothetical protein